MQSKCKPCGLAAGSQEDNELWLCKCEHFEPGAPGSAQGGFGVWGHSCAHLCAAAISHAGELSHVAQTLLVLGQCSCTWGVNASVGELQCGAVLGTH